MRVGMIHSPVFEWLSWFEDVIIYKLYIYIDVTKIPEAYFATE